VGHLQQEVLLQPEELGLRGDVADGVERAAIAELGADDLEDAHAVVAREPCTPDAVALGGLHVGRSRHEEQRVELLSRQLVLAQDAKRRRVRADDRAVGFGEEDAVAERDERVLHVDRSDRIAEPPPVGATPF